MRDPGLDEAIRAAGGVGALARKIGISQPSVSNWSHIPAERVLSVEAVTGVSRAVLRPDLYAEHPGTGGDLDEVDAARAQEYALLAALLARAPDQALLDRLAAPARRCDPARRRACGARRGREPHHCRARRARVFQSLHRARARRAAALRLVLSHRLPARAAAGAPARRPGPARHRARARARPSPRITRRSCARSWPGW